MVEVVTREELKKGLADGSIALVDVREPNEFAAGHIPGAIPLPLSRFDPAQLPRDPGQAHRFQLPLGPAHPAGDRNGAAWRTRATPAPITPGSMLDWVAAGEPVEI